MRHPLYLLYSVALLGWLGFAAYNGTPFLGARVNEVKNSLAGCTSNDSLYYRKTLSRR